MRINANSWHYRIYYRSFDFDEGRPGRETVCGYFGRVARFIVGRYILLPFLAAFCAAVALAVCGMLMLASIDHPIEGAVGAVLVAAIAFATYTMMRPKPWPSTRSQLAVRFCPFIEFTYDDVKGGAE